MNEKIKFTAKASMVAALYTVLTLISAMLGLSSGAVQIRISEALCILPIYQPAAIPGLAVGCLVSNILCGGTLYDMLLGTSATLIGAIFARMIRKYPYAAPIPNIIGNTVAVPCVLILQGIGGWYMFPYFALTVGIGEFVSCGIFGSTLVFYLERHRDVLRYL